MFRTLKNLFKNRRAIFHVMHVCVKKVNTLKNLKAQGQISYFFGIWCESFVEITSKFTTLKKNKNIVEHYRLVLHNNHEIMEPEMLIVFKLT